MSTAEQNQTDPPASKRIPKTSKHRRDVSTVSVHAGESRQKPGNAITDAIFCASTYTFPDTQSVIDFIEQKQPREEYGRYGNPGQKVVEAKLAALEGAEASALFASGMAAITGLFMAKLSSCLLYTSPSPRDATLSRMPSSA